MLVDKVQFISPHLQKFHFVCDKLCCPYYEWLCCYEYVQSIKFQHLTLFLQISQNIRNLPTDLRVTLGPKYHCFTKFDAFVLCYFLIE